MKNPITFCYPGFKSDDGNSEGKNYLVDYKDKDIQNSSNKETILDSYTPKLLKAVSTNMADEQRVMYILGTCHAASKNWIQLIKNDIKEIFLNDEIRYIATEMTSILKDKRSLVENYSSKLGGISKQNETCYVMEAEFVDLATELSEQLLAYSLETEETRENIKAYPPFLDLILDMGCLIRENVMVSRMLKIEGNQFVAVGLSHLTGITRILELNDFNVEECELTSLSSIKPSSNRINKY